MRTVNRFLFSTPLVTALLAFTGATQASAVQTFDWSGNCSDCAAAAGVASYPVSGKLTLQNYTIGDVFGLGKFVSFTYSGSLLQPAFSLSLAGDDGDAATIDYLFIPDTTGHDINADGAGGRVGPGLPNGGSLDLEFHALDRGLGRELYFKSDGGTDYWRTCAQVSCINPADMGTAGRFTLPDVQPPGVPEPSSMALACAAFLGLSRIGARRRRVGSTIR